ncbi:MAG: lytic murein transglycosylase [Nocardioidaceae bacterium]
MPSHKKLTTFQKASALVPLALLSGAWTTSLTVTNTASAEGSDGKLPDGTTVPSQAIKAPASVSSPGEIAPGVPAGSAGKVVAGASANGIPSAALSAYQRAAQVIDSADKGCNIDWTLIAAIGRVESNHGRYGGNVLDSSGVSRPGIYGIPLNGGSGTQKIGDTDAGQYDNDTKFDRAVGPMQFIPSTWSVVGVDGDGDGKRNPQDIDDAALGTAVYLCSGDEDLSTTKGQESAVYRYNHSQEYVVLVLSIMRAYASGDFSSVPTSTGGTTTFSPDYGDSVMASGVTGYHYPRSSSKGGSRGSGGGSSSAGSSAPRTSTTTGGTTSSAPSAGGGSTPNLTGGGGGGSTSSDPAAPVKKATDGVKDATGGATGTVTNTVTPLQTATTYCQSNVSAAQLTAIGGLDACTSAYLSGGATAVTNLINSLLPSVGGVTGGGGVLP